MNAMRERFWSFVDMSGGPSACWPWTRSLNAYGYGQTRFDGKLQGSSRVALSITIGPAPSNRPFALHSCRMRSCCNPNHLRWGTALDNYRDSVRDGTNARGIRNGHATLTDADAIDIRQLYAQGMLQRDIAKEYGVCRETISTIIRRIHRWRYA